METFFALLALCAGNSAITGEFPSQMHVRHARAVMHVGKKTLPKFLAFAITKILIE